MSNQLHIGFLVLFLVLNFLVDLRSHAQVLPADEVRTLQQLGTRLRLSQWNPNSNSCVTNNLVFNSGSIGITNVTCDCTFNSSRTCHITQFLLRSLNLTGELPEELANLTFLRIIDLNRNFFMGNIPRRWTLLPLNFLGLVGNFLSGTLPRELGSVTTLREILLSGNNFTGALPDTFGNLRNLTDFRIDGSTLSGRIPEFIGNWTSLTRLDMEGTSLQGPIPSSISLLTELLQLRITDLNAQNISFPDLRSLTKLTDLILRNCSITGQIPSYIGENIRNIKRL
ncbi:hypothetical protein ACHQM5_018264 [Ranunculus cassubicifolius]